MAVRNTAVSGLKSLGIIFKQHGLAHKYLDGLKGIEVGAAAHNPFGLQGSVNVAPEDDFEFYKAEQVKMCGAYAEVDIFAEAHALPLDDNSQEYVISSHVFEHLPDPVGTLKEWIRVVKDGGYIFMIVPLAGAHPGDVGRKLATIEEIRAAEGKTIETWDYDRNPVTDGRRGHYFVYSAKSLSAIIEAAFPDGELRLVESEAVDTKVGNGFTLVYQVSKPEPKVEEPEPDIAFGYDDEEEPAQKKTRKQRRKSEFELEAAVACETRWLREPPVSQFVDGIGVDISWLTEGFACEHGSTA